MCNVLLAPASLLYNMFAIAICKVLLVLQEADENASKTYNF